MTFHCLPFVCLILITAKQRITDNIIIAIKNAAVPVAEKKQNTRIIINFILPRLLIVYLL